MKVSSIGAGGGAASSPGPANDEPELTRARQQVAANRTANAVPEAPVANHVANATNGNGQRNGSASNDDSGKTHVRPSAGTGGNHVAWGTFGALGLIGQYRATQQNPVPENYVNSVNQTMMTGAEYLQAVNKSGSKLPYKLYGSGMKLGAAVGIGMGAYGMAQTGIEWSSNPNSDQAKWDFANASVQTLSNGVALLLAPLSPAIAFMPLALPDISEAHRAWQLGNQETALQQQGQDTEAGAVHESHTLASLNATPIINWFAPYYTKALTPEIEKFERAHGNFPGQPAPSEFPPGTATHPAVVDYYGKAVGERAQWLAGNMRPFLEQRFREEKAKSPDTEAVTIVARWPQTFYWPSSVPPQAMRNFDRAIALTYSAKTGSVVATYFGRDIDGTYRLPPYNHDVALRPDGRHHIFYSQMFTPGESTPVFPEHDSSVVRQS